MKILSITAQKPSSTGSGVYLTELVKAFSKQGHKQAVIAGITKDDDVCFPEGVLFEPVYFDTEELPFHICGMSDEMPYPSTRYCDMTDSMVQQFEEAFLTRIRKVLEVFQPDLLISHHLYLLTALLRENFPDLTIGAFCHNTDLRQLARHDLKKAFILENIRKLDRVYALQEAQKQEIMKVFGLPADRITIVGAGYDAELFYPPSEGKKGNGPAELLYAGKIAEKKGIACLMRCLSSMKTPPEDVTICLAGGAGDQTEYEEIRKLADESVYSVRFLGKLDRQSMAAAMREADVFVLPSFYEGLPLSVVEALASGLKVVVTDLPGLREYYSENIPGAWIRYVEPPAMEYADEPDRKALPAFEKRLAEALDEAVQAPKNAPADASRISFGGIAARVLKASGVQPAENRKDFS